jgi:hypothetical protein
MAAVVHHQLEFLFTLRKLNLISCYFSDEINEWMNENLFLPMH